METPWILRPTYREKETGVYNKVPQLYGTLPKWTASVSSHPDLWEDRYSLDIWRQQRAKNRDWLYQYQQSSRSRSDLPWPARHRAPVGLSVKDLNSPHSHCVPPVDFTSQDPSVFSHRPQRLFQLLLLRKPTASIVTADPLQLILLRVHGLFFFFFLLSFRRKQTNSNHNKKKNPCLSHVPSSYFLEPPRAAQLLLWLL